MSGAPSHGRRPPYATILLPLVLALSACGGSSASTSSTQTASSAQTSASSSSSSTPPPAGLSATEQAQIRQSITRYFMKDPTACEQDVAASLLAQDGGVNGCKQNFDNERKLGQHNKNIVVHSFDFSDSTHHTLYADTSWISELGDQNEHTVTLVNEGGRWKISSD